MANFSRSLSVFVADRGRLRDICRSEGMRYGLTSERKRVELTTQMTVDDTTHSSNANTQGDGVVRQPSSVFERRAFTWPEHVPKAPRISWSLLLVALFE